MSVFLLESIYRISRLSENIVFSSNRSFEESTTCLFNICLTIIRVSNFGTTVTEELISSSVTSIYWEQRDFKGPSLAKTQTFSYNSDIVGRESGSTYFNSTYCMVGVKTGKFVIVFLRWEFLEESWHENAASGEKWITSLSEKLATSGVLMSGFFEGLPLA